MGIMTITKALWIAILHTIVLFIGKFQSLKVKGIFLREISLSSECRALACWVVRELAGTILYSGDDHNFKGIFYKTNKPSFKNFTLTE